MTYKVQCQNCGFSFTVTYSSPELHQGDTTPVACGHCRSSNWSAHPA